jgi:beta-mannosidase
VLRKGKAVFAVPAMEARQVAAVDLADAITDAEAARTVYLEYSLLREGKTVRTATLLFVKPKHYEFLDPSLSVDVGEQEDRFLLQLSAKAYAKYVELDLAQADCVFSDNYFDLSAGQERVIEVRKDRVTPRLSLKELRGQLQVRSMFDLAD